MAKSIAEMEAEIAALKAQLKATKGSKVEIIDYTSQASGKTAKYVRTANFQLNDKETAKGLFLRVEAVDQALAALTEAKRLLGQ